MSSWEWIETYVPGGHSSRLGRYLDVVAVTENGLDSQQNSSLNLIYRIMIPAGAFGVVRTPA